MAGTLKNVDIMEMLDDQSIDEPIMLVSDKQLLCSELLQMRSLISHGGSIFLSHQDDDIPVEIRDFLQHCLALSYRY